MKGYQKTAKLIFRYIRQELKFGQERELKGWRDLSAANESFFQQATSPEHIRIRLRAHEESKVRILEKLQASFPENWTEGAPRKPALVFRILKVAAMILLPLFLIAGGILAYEVFFHSGSSKEFGMMVTVNGQRRVFTDFQLGKMAGFRGIKVKQKVNGDLLYIVPNDPRAVRGQLDTLWTSGDWRFELRLPEGSDIWMNQSSIISYPRNFIYVDTVSFHILGEAFFKIPRNTNKHYEIRSGSLVIQAAGAELDLRSNVGNEGPGVLLISGNASVKTSEQSGDTTQPVRLNPGEQARLINGRIIVDGNPDIKGITGWKK